MLRHYLYQGIISAEASDSNYLWWKRGEKEVGHIIGGDIVCSLKKYY